MLSQCWPKKSAFSTLLCHIHFVPVIIYCYERNAMILIYYFIARVSSVTISMTLIILLCHGTVEARAPNIAYIPKSKPLIGFAHYYVFFSWLLMLRASLTRTCSCWQKKKKHIQRSLLWMFFVSGSSLDKYPNSPFFIFLSRIIAWERAFLS